VHRPLLTALLIGAVASPTRAATAQSSAPAVRDSAAQRPPLVTKRDVVTFGAFVTAAAMVAPFDVRLEHAIRAPGMQHDAVARGAAHGFNTYGDPGTLAVSVAMLGTGVVAKAPTIARLGLHATEAIVLGGTTTAAIKRVAGRNRPYVNAQDSDDFVPLASGGGRASFPSGHVTAAFAFASSIATDLRTMHPQAARIAAPLLYGSAALVGAARMYDAKHWASDVLVGAGVGTLAGRVVVAYARRNPRGRLERLAGAVAVAPAPDGATALALHVTTR
jgi:membrane-associated phospholipid phosphatase